MCSGSSKYFPIVDYSIPQDSNANDVPSSGSNVLWIIQVLPYRGLFNSSRLERERRALLW